MASRAESLARQFEETNAAVIRTVEGLSEAQWRMPCPHEGRTVVVVAYHVALSHAPILDAIQTLAAGQPLPPVTMAMIDARNAQEAEQHAACTRAETSDLLRRNGQAAAAALRALSDEQLARTGTLLGQETSARQIAEGILIGHPRQHLASIQAAGAPGEPSPWACGAHGRARAADIPSRPPPPAESGDCQPRSPRSSRGSLGKRPVGRLSVEEPSDAQGLANTHPV